MISGSSSLTKVYQPQRKLFFSNCSSTSVYSPYFQLDILLGPHKPLALKIEKRVVPRGRPGFSYGRAMNALHAHIRNAPTEGQEQWLVSIIPALRETELG